MWVVIIKQGCGKVVEIVGIFFTAEGADSWASERYSRDIFQIERINHP